MSKRRSIQMLPIASAAVLILAITLVAAASQDQSRKPASGSLATSRVERFLADLEKAQSGEQAAALLNASNLTEKEMEELERELAKPAWKPKITRLNQTVPRSKSPKPTVSSHGGKSAAKVIEEKRQELAQKHLAGIKLTTTALETKTAALRVSADSARASTKRPPRAPAPAGPRARILRA